MKLKYGEIWNMYVALSKLGRQDLPLSNQCDVLRAARALKPDYDLIEKARQELVNRYGEVGENGKKAMNPGSKDFGKFMDEFGALMIKEIDLDVPEISLQDTVVLNRNNLLSLEKILKKET